MVAMYLIDAEYMHCHPTRHGPAAKAGDEATGPWNKVRDATRLLALVGLDVKGVARTPLGVRVVQLVTVCPEGSRCPERGRASTSGKEWVCTRPQDLPCSRAPVRLLWGKRRWRCRTGGVWPGSRSPRPSAHLLEHPELAHQPLDSVTSGRRAACEATQRAADR